MEVSNTGSEGSFDFTTCLHTYFKVPDVGKCELTGGFKGLQYIDKVNL